MYLAPKTKSNSFARELNYWHYAPSDGYSLDPKDSDSYLNFVLMYQIVGTLLRNGRDGIYEGYLAKSWSISSDGRKYKFIFKDNIHTATGKQITATEYAKVFHFLAKYLGSNGSSLVQFDRIIGMKDYTDGAKSVISGIAVDTLENSISFSFIEEPDDVLIAFTEPYFGFYNLDNFNESGLKDPSILDSSGVFKISSISKDRRSVKLVRNTDFPKVVTDSYDILNIKLFNKFEFINTERDTIIYGINDIQQGWNDKYTFTSSDPNMLGALILSPLKSPFNDLSLRELIRDRIHNLKNKVVLNSPRAQSTKYFNFLSKPNLDFYLNSNSSTNINLKNIEKQIVDIAYFNLLASEKEWINNILEGATDQLGIRFNLKQVDRSEISKFTSDTFYSARFVTVVVGGTISNQNNKMMFCSNLGVNFKNPSQKICNLIYEYELKSGKIDQTYIDYFNKYLWEDAVVLPMMHLGFLWMHNKNVNAKVLRLGMGMPRLDLIEYYE